MRLQLDWDAENRLVRVAPESGREQSGDVKVEFEYDYRNRRVGKRVYTWDGAEWDLTAGRKYVWDGWRLLLELDAGGETLMVLRAYTWGLDLAGQAGGPGGAGIVPAKPTAAGLLEGAGTIGGLLAVYDTYGTTSTGDDVRYLYLYDGNGNVGQLVDPVPGTYATSLFKARYEYDPYGTVVQKSGAYALGNRNPFQFSTKQFDAETGMGYWGERYYLPDVGRWANRDPIEEAGGVNLYAYVMNEPVGSVDGLGHYSMLCPHGLCGPVATSQPTSQAAAGSPSPPTEVDECSAMCRIYKAQGDPTVYRACLAGCRVFPGWECGPHCARFNNAQGKTPATYACEAGCTTVRAGQPRTRIPNNPLVPVNGCSWSPDYPVQDFTPACDEHDRCYGTCGKSKATCDDEF